MKLVLYKLYYSQFILGDVKDIERQLNSQKKENSPFRDYECGEILKPYYVLLWYLRNTTALQTAVKHSMVYFHIDILAISPEPRFLLTIFMFRITTGCDSFLFVFSTFFVHRFLSFSLASSHSRILINLLMEIIIFLANYRGERKKLIYKFYSVFTCFLFLRHFKYLIPLIVTVQSERLDVLISKLITKNLRQSHYLGYQTKTNMCRG